MLEDVVGYLACPHCRAGMQTSGRVVRCSSGHSFDVARRGYLNLAPDKTPTGDTAEMVAARVAFLDVGHFDPLTQALVERAHAIARTDGCIVDVGAGTGHHLARVLDALTDRYGLALDASKYALRRAARSHAHVGAVACDVWHSLPVRDGVAAVVLNVFAPHNGRETRRVLGRGGAAIVVTPTPRHLGEIVDALDLLSVDETKPRRLADEFGPHLATEDVAELEFTMLLARTDVAALATMGPSAHHIDARQLYERVARLPQPLEVTGSVTLTTFVAS